MTFIDTHCHLDMSPLAEDQAGVLQRAACKGVGQVVVPAYDLKSWPAVLALSSRQVHCALGVHPWVASELAPIDFPGAWKDAIQGTKAPVVAVGEIGLDTKVDQPSLAVQLALLEVQLQMAVDQDLPVILHCRGAFDELLAALANQGGKLRGVLHAFSRSNEVAERFIKAGLNVGLGGAITRPGAKKVRQAAVVLPLEKIVLETDAPSIGLDGVLPTDTEPCHVADVAAELAFLRGISLAEVAQATTNNAQALFRIDFRE